MSAIQKHHIVDLFVQVDDSLPKKIKEGRPSILTDSELLGIPVPLAAAELATFHDEMIDELNIARSVVAGLKEKRGYGEEVPESDGLYNYALGKVRGFEIAMHAVNAFVVTREIEPPDFGLDSSE